VRERWREKKVRESGIRSFSSRNRKRKIPTQVREGIPMDKAFTFSTAHTVRFLKGESKLSKGKRKCPTSFHYNLLV